ncbi:hypothetical protein CCHR01_04621 [Colletotrichum chrysophilum]|uniref:Uncharacterized protein n=1 Tax=Colletotrichum chrysophilum TaxID=1836956 RepID=A0AAD9ASQ0_9PEZI|nr:hypothetical protein CCHR01_04621 [Colletotrichum chrysophilum]
MMIDARISVRLDLKAKDDDEEVDDEHKDYDDHDPSPPTAPSDFRRNPPPPPKMGARGLMPTLPCYRPSARVIG